MSMNPEQIAARNARIQSAIAQVRGSAETTGGAVVVETDVNGTITDLRISQAAMAVDPARLAKAISQCHETARDRAQTEATRLFTELLESPEPAPRTAALGSHTAPGSDEWEESTPLRITRSL
ncbi:YbaB/EbfC family nucleoid-associated protein [Nocardia sp. NBC_01503]|uniref:YbaB/EbfC family nucleoid-associated protein n=1 Tax=Nocardia sp. NBC_01503 TaxID=2975997 RepID=UPI002E7B34FB|nr:YbaB/EbfC family nucleoid-associated protein [Nocardia sp. NBC_01503]WTL33798.1 YbaB/EbfC family nucleoid-associated protein [Nocardia sp. NBC_01503]